MTRTPRRRLLLVAMTLAVTALVAVALAPDPASASGAAPVPNPAPVASASPGTPSGLTQEEASPFHPNVVVERRVELQMRDGVALRATLFRPEAPGEFPCLVMRTPYGQEKYAAEPEFPLEAAKEGYGVFLVDVRGRYTSDGEFEAYRQEKQDGYDTIEAVAAHPICNGKVGSWGGSYPGFVQWLALSQNPPHYTTAIPDMTPVDSHHFFYLGGAFNHTWYDWFMPSIVPDLRRRAGDTSGPWTTAEAREQWQPVSDVWAMHRPLVGVPLLREHAPYFYEWMQHPDKTEWWDFADVESYIDRIEVPVHLLTGWFDNTYGPIGATRGFNAMRTRAATQEARDKTKLIIGPWTHTSLATLKTKFGDIDFGPSAGLDERTFYLRWFDARLKGVETGVDAEPPVRIFVMGENRWRDEQEWPLDRAEETALYLRGGGDANTVHGDGRLEWEPPTADSGDAADTYVYNPHDPVWDTTPGQTGPTDQSPYERREDVLVYTTAPLTEPVEVTGLVEADLYLSVDTPDTDIAVTVTDVHPDGTAYNVMGPEAGYLRLRYRDGFDHQVPMTPGQVERVRVGNMPTSIVFLPGHRIRVRITSSRGPHFDPNPNTGEEIATATRLQPATVTIHHDPDRPSRILLPVIPRQER